MKPETKTQKKVLEEVEHFLEKEENKTELRQEIDKMDNLIQKSAEINLISNFIKGYTKLALLPQEITVNELNNLALLANSIRILKSLTADVVRKDVVEPDVTKSPDSYGQESISKMSKLDKVIYIDSIAHKLHQIKDNKGESIYKEFDELAGLAKGLGESDREDRLLFLKGNNIISGIKEKLENLSGLEVLQKGGLLERGLSYWRIFERAIKGSVKDLTNSEVILLREWIFSKL